MQNNYMELGVYGVGENELFDRESADDAGEIRLSADPMDSDDVDVVGALLFQIVGHELKTFGRSKDVVK